MKLKLYFLAFVALAFFSGVSCSNTAAQQPTSFHYYKTMDYSFSYPEDWDEKVHQNGVTIVHPSEGGMHTFRENVNVLWQDLSATPMTLDEFTDFSKKQIVAASGADAIISLKRITLNGQAADELICTMSHNGGTFKVKSVWMVAHNVAYILAYTAEQGSYEHYLDAANIMINSFKLNAV